MHGWLELEGEISMLGVNEGIAWLKQYGDTDRLLALALAHLSVQTTIERHSEHVLQGCVTDARLCTSASAPDVVTQLGVFLRDRWITNEVLAFLYALPRSLEKAHPPPPAWTPPSRAIPG